MKRQIRDWLADRITIGWLVRIVWPEPEIRIGPTHCYVIRHPTLVWYLRDPHRLRDSSDDPRRQWGPIHQAWRFPTCDSAENCLMWQEYTGVIEAVKLP